MVKVSICCITFNHAPYIRQCLDGFLMQQSDFEFEILIHDDASTDGTIDIILEYQKKHPLIIKSIIQKENQFSKGQRGMNVKYNFPRAKGKYIAMCEGDDYWTDPFKIQKQVDFLEDNLEVYLSYHPVVYVDNKGNKIKNTQEENLRIYSAKEAVHLKMQPLSFLFRKIDFPIEYFQKGLLNGDVILITCLLNKGKAVNMGFIGGVYRRHEGGIHSSQNYLKQTINSVKTRKSILKLRGIHRNIKKELRKEIKRRRWKGIKYCLKKIDLRGLMQLLYS